MESVKKNYIYQVAYQILTIILPIISAPYISRVLGAAGIGEFTYSYSICVYFCLVAKLGIETYGNRTIAAVRDDKQKLDQTFSELLFLHVLISIVVISAYIVYIIFLAKTNITIAAVQSIYIVAELLQINWLFAGLEQFKIIVVRNTFIKIGVLISVFVFVRDANDVVEYCIVMAVGTLLSEISMWLFAFKYVKVVRTKFILALQHLKPLIFFFIPSIAVSIYKIMDKVMLGAMQGNAEVGYYEYTEKIVTMVMALITSLGTVMLPRMTNMLANGEHEKSKKIISMSMKMVSIVSWALCFGIIGVSKTFPVVFYGKEFVSCSPLFIGLAITIPIIAFANVIRMQYLIPNKKDRAYQISVICGAVSNIIINWLLIPRMGAMGAVVGTIVAELVVCLFQAIVCVKELPIAMYLLQMVPFLVFGLIMAIVVYFVGTMGDTIMVLALQVICGVIIYLGLSIFYLFFKKDEMIKSLFERY